MNQRVSLNDIRNAGLSLFGVYWARPMALAMGVKPSTLAMARKADRETKKGLHYVSPKLATRFLAFMAERETAANTPVAVPEVDQAQDEILVSVLPAGEPMVELPVQTVVAKVEAAPLPVRVPAWLAAEDMEILDRIVMMFEVMDQLTLSVVSGDTPSLIISGPPGIGKTHSTANILKKAKAEGTYVDIVRGGCSATGLYQALFNARDGGILLIDDCDGVFDDENAMNLLKAALDSGEVRTLSWRKQAKWIVPAAACEDGNYVTTTRTKTGEKDEAGHAVYEDVEERKPLGALSDLYPNEFDFNGSVIFITNKDFEQEIAAETKMKPHFEALMSRSFYMDLGMRSVREKLIRLGQGVYEIGVLNAHGFTKDDLDTIMSFVTENADRFMELSFRFLDQVARQYKLGSRWREVILLTKGKKQR